MAKLAGRLKTLLVRHYRSVLFVLIVSAIFWYVPSGYVLTSPGSAVAVSPMITVEGEEVGAHRTGESMLITVYTREANLAVALYGMVHPRAELRPRTIYVEDDQDFEEYLQLSREMMRESQQIAVYTAMREAGLEVNVTGDGAEVASVRSDSPARDKIHPGDVILRAAGEVIQVTDDLLDVVGRYQAGDELELELERDGEMHQVRVSLMSSPDDPERSMIGIGVLTRDVQFEFPVDVQINAGAIGGPSAGLAFVLTLVDHLRPEWELLQRDIATTGSVNTRGEVGSVGGVGMKAWTASRAGAEVLLVPRENYQDALAPGTDIEVVPVDTVEEAIDFLREFSASSSSWRVVAA